MSIPSSCDWLPALRPLAMVAAAVLSIGTAAAADDAAWDYAAWKADRDMRFAAFKASHPPQDAAITDIKERTAALVAAYQPPAGSPLDQPSVVWRTSTEPAVVFDASFGPRLVVVPAGEFTMGSPDNEPGRQSAEAPRHRVRIGHALAVGMFPITYGEFAWFVFKTHHKTAGSCATPVAGALRQQAGHNWDNTGFPQNARTPATCMDYNDAVAYAAWLSKETGQLYRLLSEAEYEYVNRGGSTTAWWWGDDRAAGCKLVNGLDRTTQAVGAATGECDDGWPFVSSLELAKPNGFGVFDTTGNVASWIADCWRANYAQASANGAAASTGDCRWRVVRGGSWASPAAALRTAARARAPVAEATAERGFRVARDL